MLESWGEKSILLLFCFGNNQANSSFVGSLRKVLCPRGGACCHTTFITGNRNALISKRAPSLRVRGFTHFRYCLGFPSFAESVHKGPVCRLFGMQTHAQGAGMSPSKLWDGLAGQHLLLGKTHCTERFSKRVFSNLWPPIPSSVFLVVQPLCGFN